MHIEPITTVEFFDHPDAATLLAGYGAECAIDGLPTYCPHRDMYGAMEQTGAVRTFAAFEGDHMLGVLVLLVTMNPHYSVPLAVVESWFVAPEHRASGAGLALYRAAKDAARAAGARAVLVSAPAGGQLAGVMEAMGAVETNRVFCEVLA
jgi:GNAT superfamily N-acetyltransferase